MLVYGHRGARGARPENTMEAFEYAIGVGADGIELDVAVTRDNVPVISHDPWLASGTVIRELDWHELRTLAPSVPLLAEVLALPGTFRFLIEVKCFLDRPEFTAPPDDFAALVLRDIDRAGVATRSIVQSFDFRILHSAAILSPEIPRGALFDVGDDFVAMAHEAKAGIAVPEFYLVTADRVRAAHAAGLEVYAWTPNSPTDWLALSDAGVDAIITDDPGGLVRHLD